MCEKQEWENASGKPYPRFLTFLRGRLKTNQMSDEQAIAAVHKALKDTSQAAEHWESFKRTVVTFADQWERDKVMGLSGAYVPPELLPDAEVAIEEAATEADPEEESLEEKVAIWQRMWNAPKAEVFGRPLVKRWVEETPGVILNEDGPALENREPAPVKEQTLKVGDRVFLNSHPHTDPLGPYPIEWIDGAMAKLENFKKPLLLKDLRRGD
jgi:hypothetical protein